MTKISNLTEVFILIAGLLLIAPQSIRAQSMSPKQSALLQKEMVDTDKKLADSNTRFAFLAESLSLITKPQSEMDKEGTHAILALEKGNVEMAIPFLVKQLGLVSYYANLRQPMAATEKIFVASKALISYGPPSIPYLIDSLTVEPKKSIRWANASSTISTLADCRSESACEAFFHQQANRYDEQERFLRYLSKDISQLVLQDNLLPKAAETEKSVFTDEQLRSCFEKSLLIWKAGPQPPIDLPIGEPLPPEPVEVPVAGAPTPEQIEKAILELGEMRCEYAIPALYRRLDFKVTRADESFYYPAVTALSKFGESAIEPLIGQLAQPYQKRISYQNGVSVLVNITGSEAKASEALLKGADEAKRRATYIRDMVKKWESPQ